MAITGQCGLVNIPSPRCRLFAVPSAALPSKPRAASHPPEWPLRNIRMAAALMGPGGKTENSHGSSHCGDYTACGIAGRLASFCPGQLHAPHLLPAEGVEHGMRIRFDGAMRGRQERQYTNLLA